MQGKPVAAADVLFCPDKDRPSNATTDQAGRFIVRTWGDGDGGVAGMHVVCVTKTEQTGARSSSPYAETRNMLPGRYASPLTSPLRAEVVPGQKNHFHFELEP